MDKENTIIKLHRFIYASNMSEKQKSDMLALFYKMDKKTIDTLAQIAKTDDKIMEKINDIYQSKKEAVRNKDTDKWKQIIEKEKKLLQNQG